MTRLVVLILHNRCRKTSSHFHISTICIDLTWQIGISDFFSGLVFEMIDSDLSDSEQPLEDGSWSVSQVALF